MVESILTTVGAGVRSLEEMSTGDTPHRFMVQINFVDFVSREGISTSEIMKNFGEAFLDQYPGISFILESDAHGGPPTGPPVNIEIAGKDFDQLLLIADSIISKINDSPIQGIEGLKTDIILGKPELLVEIDRDKAQRYGLSTLTIASTIRTALFGKEISGFKIGEDEYPINIRLAEEYRTDLSSLMNQKISFFNQATGMLAQVPISAVASFYIWHYLRIGQPN